jgi:hypothetical protein
MRLSPSPRVWTEADLRASGLVWNGETLAPRPFELHLETTEIDAFARGAEALLRAAEIVTDALPTDPALGALFGFDALRMEAIARDPGYTPRIPLGRLDGFLVDGAPRFLELNTDGTAGWHWADALARLAGVGEGSPLCERLLATLLRCFRQWDRRGVERPRTLLCDWAEVGTVTEQRALVAFFGRRGLDAALADPRALERKGGRLLFQGRPVDLVYRRLVSEEAFARPEASRALLDAYLAGEVCLVGGFRTDPAWTKTLFAVLSDPSFEYLFPAELRGTLRLVTPWTRMVRPGPADVGGGGFDLAEYLRAEKDALLLKPARSWEGRGLVAGPRVTPEVWAEACQRALTHPGRFVAQAFQRPASLSCGAFRAVVQPGAFVLGGRLAGFLVRGAPDELIGAEREEWMLPCGQRVAWTGEGGVG